MTSLELQIEPTSNMPTPRDSLRDALAEVIAHERREWRRERAIIEAQARETIATLRSEFADFRAEMRSLVMDRLEALRDGTPGRDGSDGKDGAPGERGMDGAAGRDGADGAPGRDGIDGRNGVDGNDGAPGEPGQDGANGQDGAAGRDGLDGPAGRDGRDGLDGAPGRDGVDGAPGERGPEGPVGKLPLVRDWQDRVHYEGDVVNHAGSCWQAVRDTGREPPHADWQLLASAGRDGVDGADGRSFAHRGTWIEVNSYSAMDVVALGGSSFVAKHDDPGPCPGEGWQLMASKGSRGPQGERGLPGERGPAGADGAFPIAFALDESTNLVITLSDGSELTCDLYPILSKIA